MAAQEIEKHSADLLGLFLLYPMPGALDQIAAEHLRATRTLHALEIAGALIRAPISVAGDKDQGTSIARPEKRRNSASDSPVVRLRYQLSPPWKPLRWYSPA